MNQKIFKAVIYDPQQISILDMVQGVMREVELESGGSLTLTEKFVVNKKDEGDEVCRLYLISVRI